jgi:hypothetical protein
MPIDGANRGGMEDARAGAKPRLTYRDLCRRPRDPVPKGQSQSGLATATRENARGALTYRDHEKVAQGLLSVHSFVRSGNHSFAPTWRSVRRRAQTPSRSAVAPAVPQTLTSPGRTLTVASTAARLRPVGGEADLDRLFAAAPSGSYATPRHRSQFRFPCSLQRTGSASPNFLLAESITH